MRTKKEQEGSATLPKLALVPPATDEEVFDWLMAEADAQVAREDEEVERMRRGELLPNETPILSSKGQRLGNSVKALSNIQA